MPSFQHRVKGMALHHYWIGVVHRDHVSIGVEGGFAQLGYNIKRKRGCYVGQCLYSRARKSALAADDCHRLLPYGLRRWQRKLHSTTSQSLRLFLAQAGWMPRLNGGRSHACLTKAILELRSTFFGMILPCASAKDPALPSRPCRAKGRWRAREWFGWG
jgi:hypothetical protein